MKQAEQEKTPVIDVDGSYLYKKYLSLTEGGQNVSLLGYPSPPIAGWKTVTESTCLSIASTLPSVSSGMSHTE